MVSRESQEKLREALGKYADMPVDREKVLNHYAPEPKYWPKPDDLGWEGPNGEAFWDFGNAARANRDHA